MSEPIAYLKNAHEGTDLEPCYIPCAKGDPGWFPVYGESAPLVAYVVMGNDFPDAVFSTEDDAEKHCRDQKFKNSRIYWRMYRFEVRGST